MPPHEKDDNAFLFVGMSRRQQHENKAGKKDCDGWYLRMDFKMLHAKAEFLPQSQ